MKKRTRIARWVFVMTSVIPPTLVTIPIMVAWYYLVRRRAWAWWGLMGLYVMQVFLLLPYMGPSKRHPAHWPWYDVLVFLAVLTIPALCILLTDRPSGWKPQGAADDLIGHNLKRWTRVVAWIGVASSGAGFLGWLASEPMSRSIGPQEGNLLKGFAQAVFGPVQFCFWTGLLYERRWGWWGSVATTFISGLWGIWFIAFKPVQGIASHEVYNSPQAVFVYSIVGLLLTAFSMWILLTDRPSDWRPRMPEPAPPPKPKTEEEWVSGKRRRPHG